jgi:hypothetical protein
MYQRLKALSIPTVFSGGGGDGKDSAAALRAWMRVVSNSGTAASCCDTNSEISVQPRTQSSFLVTDLAILRNEF